MRFNSILAGAAVAAAVLSSPAALAGALTGNVGAYSAYMFRGVESTPRGTPAVQGGVDYAMGNGIYAGTWTSNTYNGNELDGYAGYTGTVGSFGYDAGVIYYLFTEDKESSKAFSDADTFEVYGGGSFGPVSAKVYFSPDLADSGDSSIYITASATLSLNDTLSVVPEIGFNTGDGVKKVYGDNYTDYSLSLVKSLKDELSVSFAIVGTDLSEGDVSGTLKKNDQPKFVVGLKKSFKL